MTHQEHGPVEKEWNKLEEAGKEAVRAIVSQDGLWESDLIALLKTRGFLHPKASLESLALRASFVKCGFDGHYSIPPDYQAQVAKVLATDDGEESLDSLKRNTQVSAAF